MDRGQIGPGEVLCWRTPGLAESFFLGDMRPCRRKPFFLGDMMLQRENRNGNRFCNAWRLGSTIPFFFLAAGILNVTVAPWQYNSLFFFLAAAISHCPTGHLWPSGQMASGKKRLAFFFLVPWPMSFPVCANEKKNKNKKKSCKKKVLLYKY